MWRDMTEWVPKWFEEQSKRLSFSLVDCYVFEHNSSGDALGEGLTGDTNDVDTSLQTVAIVNSWPR
jgi:hypothetical protein